MLDELRQTLRRLQRPPAFETGAAAVPLGAPEIDAALGGGLARATLHEVSALSEAHLPAATGFAARVARSACAPSPRLRGEDRGEGAFPPARARSRAPTPACQRLALAGDLSPQAGRGGAGTVVWLAEDMSLAESGALYGPGLLDCGLAPERLVTVAAANRRDLLWAMEEALRCRSVRVAVGEMRAGALDGVAVRRLSLAAAESGALALLLRAAPPEDASTAATRWIVGAAPHPPLIPAQAGIQNGSSTRSVSTGSPLPRGRTEESIAVRSAFAVRLVRNRRGPLGSWIFNWSDDDGAHAQPLAATAADRPHGAVA